MISFTCFHGFLRDVIVHRSNLMGESLESCSFEELLELEAQLEKSLSNIRARKVYKKLS